MTRMLITTLSRMIAKGLPTFSCGELAEPQRALLVETETDDRLVVPAVEGRLGVDEVRALDGRPARSLNPHPCRRLVAQRELFAIERRLVGFGGRLAFAQELELQLARSCR